MSRNAFAWTNYGGNVRENREEMLGDSAYLVTSPLARPFSCPVHVGCSGQVVETVRARLTFRRPGMWGGTEMSRHCCAVQRWACEFPGSVQEQRFGTPEWSSSESPKDEA